MGDGEGVSQQNEQQRRPQGGGAVPLPAEQRGNLKQDDHNGRPDDGRGTPGHHGKQDGHGDEHQSGPPPAAAQQEGQQSRQKHQMGAGHRHCVGEAGALEVGVEGVGQVRPVSRDQGLGQGRHILGKDALHALLQRPGPIGRPVPDGWGFRPLHIQAAVGPGGEENSLGGVIGDLLPGGGTVRPGTVGHRLDFVPGAQVRPLLIQIQQSPDVRAGFGLQADLDGETVVGLLGPLGHGALEADGGVVQGQGGPPEQGGIPGGPEKPQGQPGRRPAHRLSDPFLSFHGEKRKGGQYSRGDSQRDQRPIQGQVPGAQGGQSKGKGEDSQPAHGISSSLYNIRLLYYSGFSGKGQVGPTSPASLRSRRSRIFPLTFSRRAL